MLGGQLPSSHFYSLASVLRRKRPGNQIQFRLAALKKQYEVQKALKSYFTDQADD